MSENWIHSMETFKAHTTIIQIVIIMLRVFVINACTWCVLVARSDTQMHKHSLSCTLHVCELLRNEMLAGGKCKFLLIYVV